MACRYRRSKFRFQLPRFAAWLVVPCRMISRTGGQQAARAVLFAETEMRRPMPPCGFGRVNAQKLSRSFHLRKMSSLPPARFFPGAFMRSRLPFPSASEGSTRARTAGSTPFRAERLESSAEPAYPWGAVSPPCTTCCVPDDERWSGGLRSPASPLQGDAYSAQSPRGRHLASGVHSSLSNRVGFAFYKA